MEFVLEPINITKDLILNRISEEKLMKDLLSKNRLVRKLFR